MAEPSSCNEASTRFRVYTRTGDDGTSCLYSGQRLSKDNAFFQALGDVDELNSCLGIAREYVQQVDTQLAEQLAVIQSRLIDVGSALATPAHAAPGHKVARTRFAPEHTSTLEGWLDAMDDQLPPLKHFILPSGGLAATHLHHARSTARRAERAVIALHRLQQQQWSEGYALPGSSMPTLAAGAGDVEEAAAAEGEAAVPRPEAVDPAVRVYLNRLSDFLFTAARFMAKAEGRPEEVYKKAAA